MMYVSLGHSPAFAAALLLTFAGLASADTPRAKIPQQEPASSTKRPEAPVKTQAEIEAEAKQTELERRALRQAANQVQLQGEYKAWWDALSPRMKDVISPEISAAQYELIESKLKEHGRELLEVVDQAYEDDVVRLLEFGTIQARWELIEIKRTVAELPETKARTKDLIRAFRKAQR
jgi:hypothetical protein